MLNYHAAPGGVVQGTLRVPGDKSISHRAIMLGAIADGVSEVTGFLEGADALSTMNACRAMGVVIDGPHDGRVTIHGVGKQGLRAPSHALDCGNAGTAMRLLAGLLAGQGFAVTLTGDASLSQRPMRRVTMPLALMGAQIKTAAGDRPPLHIQAAEKLHGIDYPLPMASAQVKSCLLLAGLYAQGTTAVTEPAPTRDHTERMLMAFGYPLQRAGNTVSLSGGGTLTATQIDVPADISSAAFFMVAASIAPGSDLLLQHVGINPTRTGVIDILRLMGADLTLQNERMMGGEPVADIRVRAARLHGITIPPQLVPLAIDEFPVLFIAAANAVGETVLSDAAELRVKESDRIAVMAAGMQTLGIQADVRADGIRIMGNVQSGAHEGVQVGAQVGQYGGGVVNSQGDHRIAMSFAVAALNARADITIRDCANVATSFPGFVELAQAVGMTLKAVDE